MYKQIASLKTNVPTRLK